VFAAPASSPPYAAPPGSATGAPQFVVVQQPHPTYTWGA
jgi:hypothetical protein